MATKTGLLLKDIRRNLSMLFRVLWEGKWKFARFILRSTFCGLVTLRCKQCGASCWYTASTRCGSCQLKNLMAAINDESYDKPCIACGEKTSQICENCEAPLCYACDACTYHDVLVCKDEAACSRRCVEKDEVK